MVARTRKCSVAYLAAILLLPLLSWITATGGFPLCCWGMNGAMSAACPMRATMSGKASCPMNMLPPSAPASCSGVQTQLTLPTPLIPVVPLPPRPRPAAAAPHRAAASATPAVALAGWPGSVFHPPAA